MVINDLKDKYIYFNIKDIIITYFLIINTLILNIHCEYTPYRLTCKYLINIQIFIRKGQQEKFI